MEINNDNAATKITVDSEKLNNSNELLQSKLDTNSKQNIDYIEDMMKSLKLRIKDPDYIEGMNKHFKLMSKDPKYMEYMAKRFELVSKNPNYMEDMVKRFELAIKDPNYMEDMAKSFELVNKDSDYKDKSLCNDPLHVLAKKEKEIVTSYNDMMKELEEEIDREEDDLFDVFHAVHDKGLYRVRKELITVYQECDRDRIYTEKEFEELENRVMKWFENLADFAEEWQWDNYQGIQFNLTGNIKIYRFVQQLAEQGDMYALDFLIFNALQVEQHEQCDSLDIAKEFYLMVKNPDDLPLNEIYRAILFGEYFDLVRSCPKESLFSYWYEWNLDINILLDEITRQELTFDEKENQMILWFLTTKNQKSTKSYRPLNKSTFFSQ